ncbi:hypothetical protein B0T18DRAFT_219637 [Schizothecium vesticola]|uniref:Uncharacterized protein n=1 Tax=Schizothecium vesticola TaxID=314040 RepID=A0AA40EK88_9PEZI|nr:hypothetical protein B0T18DRAFT_219637 [Schizothecium vesticola]
MHASPCERRAQSRDKASTHTDLLMSLWPVYHPPAPTPVSPPTLDPFDRSQSPHASPSISTPLTQHPRSSSRPRRGEAPQPPPVSFSRTHDTQQCPLAGRVGAGTVVLDGGTEERDGHLPDRGTVWLALFPLITIGVTHHHDGPQRPPLRFPPPTGGSEKGGEERKENRDMGTGARHQKKDNALEIRCNGGGAQGLRRAVISLRFLVSWDREEARDRNARSRLAHLRDLRQVPRGRACVDDE